MALKPCARAGCPNVVVRGYCDDCKPASAKRIFDRHRGSSAQRGYDYRWQQFRAQYLMRHPLCADCEEHGRYTSATEPHHVKKVAEYPELRLSESNLVPLCHECHAVRTRRGE